MAIVLVVVLLALVATVAVFAVRIRQVGFALEDTAVSAEAYFEALQSDPEAAPAALDEVRKDLVATSEELDAFPLDAAAAIPGLGRNVTESQKVLDEITVLVDEVGPVLNDIAVVYDFENERIRFDSGLGDLISSSGDVVTAAPGAITSLREARDEIDAIDTEGLIGPVGDGIEETQAMVSEAYALVEPIDEVLSGMSSVTDGVKDLGNFDLSDIF